MHPALPASQLTIAKGNRPHGIALDCHDKIASYVGKEAGPSRSGATCTIQYVSYVFHVAGQSKKPVKQIMFTCFHVPKIFMFPCYNISRRREGICIEANCCRFSVCVCVRVCTQKQHQKQTKQHSHTLTHTHTNTNRIRNMNRNGEYK